MKLGEMTHTEVGDMLVSDIKCGHCGTTLCEHHVATEFDEYTPNIDKWCYCPYCASLIEE